MTGRKFCVGDKVLILLPTELKKLFMQWKGPFDIMATVGAYEYRINVNGKEKIFHANLLKTYIKGDTTSNGDANG
ncbi:Zinc finger protein [Plakobranchus ocellatus]|uniref:Zinc finger protein n=1 Tax=Plakobranchus ocellatus TaxID=259542 RepID=A0AAV3ZKB1_9GAST|nr:Zinc finger protein [Plakobranchus ocellatus]